MPLPQSRDSHNLVAAVAPQPAPSFNYEAWNELLQDEHFFFRVDLHHKIELVSDSVRQKMGYRPEDLIGKEYHEFFDLDHPRRVR